MSSLFDCEAAGRLAHRDKAFVFERPVQVGVAFLDFREGNGFPGAGRLPGDLVVAAEACDIIAEHFLQRIFALRNLCLELVHNALVALDAVDELQRFVRQGDHAVLAIAGIASVQGLGAGFRTIDRRGRMGLHEAPEFLFVGDERLDVLFIAVDALPLGFIAAEEHSDIPVIGARDGHVVETLAVVGIRDFIALPFLVVADAGGLDFKAGIFAEDLPVDVRQHEGIGPVLERAELADLLSRFFLEPVSDVRFVLRAPVDVLITGKIRRGCLPGLFHPELVRRLVGVQPHDDGGVAAADAHVAGPEPFVMILFGVVHREDEFAVAVCHIVFLSFFCYNRTELFLYVAVVW